jgi:hypothetical protein
MGIGKSTGLAGVVASLLVGAGMLVGAHGGTPAGHRHIKAAGPAAHKAAAHNTIARLILDTASTKSGATVPAVTTTVAVARTKPVPAAIATPTTAVPTPVTTVAPPPLYQSAQNLVGAGVYPYGDMQAVSTNTTDPIVLRPNEPISLLVERMAHFPPGTPIERDAAGNLRAVIAPPAATGVAAGG